MLVSLILLAFSGLASSTRVLLITPNSPSREISSCFSHFLGSYGVDASERYNVFRGSSIECTNGMQMTDDLDEGRIVPIEENARVVYLQEAGVDQSLHHYQSTFVAELDAFLRRARVLGAPDVLQQKALLRPPEIVTLHHTLTSALVSVPDSLLPVLDTLLPRLFSPITLPEDSQSFIPVPPSAIKHVSDVLASLRFNPDIAAITNHLSVAQMENDIRFLTGEDRTSGIVSRHSFTQGARTAAVWIKARIESTGATCELRPFLVGFAPNVVCRYPSSINTTSTVLLSAHYDSRGTFGSTRAPGGNDDGSGVLSLLGIARAIGGRRVTFRSNVELVAFAGEEQGLLGSRAYAKDLRDVNTNLTLMIQADMLAYHHPDEPPQLGQPKIGSPVAAQLVANVSRIYSPELTVGFTPACCSDHQESNYPIRRFHVLSYPQPFHEQGFPATHVFERAGPIADPMYHNSGDLSDREGYDLEQVRSIAKVTLATLLHTAGFDIPG